MTIEYYQQPRSVKHLQRGVLHRERGASNTRKETLSQEWPALGGLAGTAVTVTADVRSSGSVSGSREEVALSLAVDVLFARDVRQLALWTARSRR